jgi:outer membrane protein assembly factor BamB
MKKSGLWWKIAVAVFVFLLSGLVWIQFGPDRAPVGSRYRILYPTFLGNSGRNFYGRGIPDSLYVIWQVYLGGSQTRVGKRILDWSGTGWTGQPTMLREAGRDYIIIGGFDHQLRKLDAETGQVIWAYVFDDVIKGAATLMPICRGDRDLVLILQGSRMGFNKNLGSAVVTSFRAIDADGREAWRLNLRRTDSYSRDVDASALVLDTLLYLGAENGVFYIIDPDPEKCVLKDGVLQPRILKEITLYEPGDAARHGGNLVTEASPTLCGGRIYIAAGSGHVYGINLRTWEVDWRFDTGSDLDGTLSVTADSCLLLAMEKQYISDRGGVFKLDPRKPAVEAVVWFFPTGNRRFSDWEGGVVGSAAVQDSLVAFRAIDGNLYLVNHYVLEPGATARFKNRFYPQPKLLNQMRLSPAIATPLIVDGRILTVGYDDKIRIFCVERKAEKTELTLQDSLVIAGFFESTPLVWNDRIYVGNRNGYFYCVGVKSR